MPATNPRISSRSLSVLVRDILTRYYTEEEERFWAEAGEERLATFEPQTALSHAEAWGEEFAECKQRWP